jgi:hypothetical protein
MKMKSLGIRPGGQTQTAVALPRITRSLTTATATADATAPAAADASDDHAATAIAPDKAE